MPLYEYRCRACGRRFEVLQKMGDGAEGLECPHCGGTQIARQLSTFAAGGSSGKSAEAVSCGAPGCAAGGSGFT